MKNYTRSVIITTNFESIGGAGIELPANISSDNKTYLVIATIKRLSSTGGTPVLSFSITADRGAIIRSTEEDTLTVSSVASALYGGSIFGAYANMSANEGSMAEIVLVVQEIT